MFTFLKRRRAELDARTTIGIELHRQLKEAFDQNEMETSSHLLTFFTAGYLYGFVRLGFFTLTGVSGEEATDKHMRRICDGVLPNKLWDDLNRKLEALNIAVGMDDQQKTIRRGSGLTPAESIKLFEDGTKIGGHDASYTFRGTRAQNLKRYLVGELDVESFYKSIYE